MRNSVRRSLLGITLLLILLVSGCYIDFGGGGGAKSVTIDSVGWVYSNVNPSFWTTDVPEGTPTPEVLVSFSAQLVETNLLESDIASVALSAQNVTWVRDSGEFDYDSGSRVVSMPLNYSSSTPYSLPLSGWELTVELTNGAAATVSFDLPLPGTTSTDATVTHVFNENYGNSTTDRVEMVRKPTIVDSTKGSSTLFIDFNIDDTNVYNGFVLFYDANNRELGSSLPFVDWGTGAVNDVLSTFMTDGTDNTLSIRESEMSLISGASYADVTQAAIVVTDGGQYDRDDPVYDFIGISKRFTFN